MPRDDCEPIIPSIRVSNLIKRDLEGFDSDYFLVLSGDDFYVNNHIVEKAIKFLDDAMDYSAYVSGFSKVCDSRENRGYKVRSTVIPQICHKLYIGVEVIFTYHVLYSDE